MPKNIKITKEMIIDAAFKITREKGFNKVSNREIAKELNCSIRPIYYQFKNASELNVYLFKKVENYFYNYLIYPYQQTLKPDYRMHLQNILFLRYKYIKVLLFHLYI